MLFNELGLSDEVLRAVTEAGYETPTEIQEKTIPLLLEGKDVIGRSQTGSGKTAAFGLPAIDRMNRDDIRSVQVLILCPTRELAMQACEEISKFSHFMPWVKPCAVYGGAEIEPQINRLRRGANIVVGTPGRVMDHIRRRTLKLENITEVILDEADEMLDMGFREDIESILSNTPETRQTALFSATMPQPILALTKKFQKDPVLVGIEQKSRTVDSIAQYYYEVPMGRKTDALCMLMLDLDPKLSIIFCNTKQRVDELTEALIASGFKAAGLHGDMKQGTRTQVLNAFKTGRLNILVATDVAARGIDVDNVDAVFNYDIPQDMDYYIHRVGRTGRAGKAGIACTIVSGRAQVNELNAIARFARTDIKREQLPTRDDIINKKKQGVTKKIMSYADSGKYSAASDELQNIICQGYTAEQIATVLLGMRFSKETRTVPDFIRPSGAGDNGGRYHDRVSKSVRLEISLGRDNRIAPNFIIGAFADATGLTGKSFGKIEIYDKFSTVEVPSGDADHVIEMMNGNTINGQKAVVKLYEGKAAQSSARGKRDDGKDYRRLDKKNPHGRFDRRPRTNGPRRKRVD